MKLRIKSCLLQNKAAFYNKSRLTILILSAFYSCFSLKAQEPANYVNNGGFELTLPSYTINQFDVVKFWAPINVSKNASFLFSTALPLTNAPYCNTGYQQPKTGHNFIGTQFYCNTCVRFYPRNTLKQTLKPNSVYCGKYYVVNTNNNRIAIDSYGMYVGNATTIDTIKECMVPLTYLNPQVENITGYIITDTLEWTAISGTFTANGTEKYLILGNFKSNPATNTLIINTPTFNVMSNDIYIDDVSLIEMDLPAYAGPDKAVKPGDSVFIGRQPDVGIDEACRWYKLPTVITPSTPAMDTVAGIWVKPALTSTYVVKQQLWCSGVKYDTVVVFMNYVGLNEQKRNNEEIKIWPNPASDVLYIDCSLQKNTTYNLQVIDLLGQTVKEEEITLENGTAQLNINKLPAGVYFLVLKSGNALRVSYKFVKEK